jgi:uncharacterized protein
VINPGLRDARSRLWLLGVGLMMVLAWLMVLLNTVLIVPSLDFPQFAAAFALGDLRLTLWLLVTASTIAVALIWRMLIFSSRWRTVARTTTVLGCIVVVATGWRQFGTYSVSVVTFPSKFSPAGENVSLGARIYTPRASGHHPAVLLVPGSEDAPGVRYHSFADRFARAGYVVLVPDKRGVGRSGGVEQQTGPDSAVGRATVDTLASDVVAGMRYLRTVAGIDTHMVGYFGLSQAGWVIPIAEQDSTGANFAVIMSGPAVSFREEDVFSQLSGEGTDHFGWMPPKTPLDTINARVDREQPSGFDAREMLSRMNMPVLWLYGTWDNSIPVQKSVRNLEQLRAEGRPFTVRSYQYGNHGVFVVRGPAKRLLPYYPDGLWTDTFAWLDALRAQDR